MVFNTFFGLICCNTELLVKHNTISSSEMSYLNRSVLRSIMYEVAGTLDLFVLTGYVAYFPISFIKQLQKAKQRLL